MQFTFVQYLAQLTVFEVIAIVLGILLGYYITRIVVGRRSVEMVKYMPAKNTVREEVIKHSPIKEPEDFNELVKSIRDKFMLLDVTLATSDGFPIASTSDKPEDESAIAPEILRKIGKNVFNSKEVILLGKDYKLGVFEINPDVIGFIKASRDIHFIEIDKIKNEVNRFLEVKV
jgi:hypothetical protein